MDRQTVKLIDGSGRVVAVARVAKDGEGYRGTIDLGQMPVGMRAVFAEFEDIVSNQMFSFLDEIQAKKSAIPINVVFDNGGEAYICDLQVYPSTGDVSFKVAEVAARTA
jgi:hypothetical protein